MRRPVPEIREDPAYSPRMFLRSIVASAQAMGGNDPIDVAKRLWPTDRDTIDFLTRGAVVPTTTTTSGISVSTGVAALLPLLGPTSAVGAILKRCLSISFGQNSTISIPVLLASAVGVNFITQGSPFAIRQFGTGTSLTVTPRKLAFGSAMTRELYEHSNAEALLANVIAKDLSLGIETLLFDDVAADITRPAGLKNGIDTETADTGTDVTAMFNDLATLGAKVATVGGTNFCYIASVKQAIKINLRKSQNQFPFPVYASSGLADKCVAALAFDALAVVGGNDPPRYEISKVATAHMEQDSPLPISSSGPPSFAAPVKNFFQQDLIGLKIIQDLSWQLRSTSGFAYITAVNW